MFSKKPTHVTTNCEAHKSLIEIKIFKEDCRSYYKEKAYEIFIENTDVLSAYVVDHIRNNGGIRT